MLSYLKTTGIGPADQFELELLPRLNVITGDNGVGKTLLLDLAWWACTRDWNGQPVIPRSFVIPVGHGGKQGEASFQEEVIRTNVLGRNGSIVESTFSFFPDLADWKRQGRARPPIIGLVIYARVDGGFSVWDPSRHYYRKAPSRDVDEPDRPPAFHFTKAEVWSGKRVESIDQQFVVICEGLARDWLEWEMREPDLFQIFTSVLEHLSPPGEPLRPAKTAVRLPGPDVRSQPALDSSHGIIPLSQTSEAVRRIISLAYFLVWSWHQHQMQCRTQRQEPENRIILVMDEVEAHLHPKWQRRILPALLSVVQKLNAEAKVQLILSTHSPLVLASLEPEFQEEQDRLFHMQMEQGKVHLQPYPWKRYGDASGWLTSDIFALGEARSVPAERAIEASLKFMNGDTDLPPDLSSAAAIESALCASLPNLDPAWVRWQMFKERRAKLGQQL